MHGFWSDPDVWKSIIGTVGNILAGVALLLVRRWMRNMERDHAEHKKEVAAKLAADVSASDVHSRSAAAGQSDDLHRPACNPHPRGNGGLPDRKR